MALPLMRRRGPGISPSLMALRTAVSAEPAPSVPMSRSAVKPAIRSAFAASVARIVRCGTDSSTVCRSSAPGCRNRCTCASISPGISVTSPRSMTCAPAGRLTFGANLDDAIALDQHFAGSDDLAALDVEHARRVQDDRWRLRFACVEKDGQEEQ